METTKLRRFAQYARRSLMEQVSTKLGFALADDSAARRENPAAVADLQKQISESSQDQVVEKSLTPGSTGFVLCVSWI